MATVMGSQRVRHDWETGHNDYWCYTYARLLAKEGVYLLGGVSDGDPFQFLN